MTDEQPSITDEMIAELSKLLNFYADIYAGKSSGSASPLYEFLARQVAQDPEVLALLAVADRHQQISHLLFGAVHFILLGGEDHPVARYYASLTADPLPPDGAYPDFRDFCLSHSTLIERIVESRRVQTNEISRCTAFVPAFETVSNLCGREPLAMVEIGASAGFNMLWDKYAYDYGDAGKVGPSDASVMLTCSVRGDNQPPVPEQMPTVASRIGIDLYPIDVRNEPAVRWLQALIWPEQADRAELIFGAIDAVRKEPPAILGGNVLDLLDGVLDSLPYREGLGVGYPDGPQICVYHSYTLNQAPRSTREKVDGILKAHSTKRDIYRVSLEWFGHQEKPHLELFAYKGGEVETTLLAYCEAHGRWIEWVECSAASG